jgi:uncharacterized membrane protein YeaQ/YmgE (transglycosylase-associated protein family)
LRGNACSTALGRLHCREGHRIMEPQSLIVFLLVGLVAGWLAGKLVRGGGFGLIGDIIVGVIGAFIGGWLLPKVGITSIVHQPIIDAIISATIGAVILLFILRLIKR